MGPDFRPLVSEDWSLQRAKPKQAIKIKELHKNKQFYQTYGDMARRKKEIYPKKPMWPIRPIQILHLECSLLFENNKTK